ncbi:hypothetical protein JCM10450v2_004549 [Rhodotorula kratochvilovae]
MPPTRRSETAPRRSSRVTDLEKVASAAQKAAAAAADKAKKEAAAAARKAAQATKKTKKTVRRNVVKPAARAVAKAAGVDPDNKGDDKPKPKRKAPTARTEGAAEAKKQKKDDKKEDATPSGKVSVGDIVPDVKLRDEDDKEVSLKSLYDENALVIFSYPKADTPGCTTQACLYRDSVSEGAFTAVGYTVLGLSRDKPTAQNKWKTKHTLGYTLLSDPEGELLGQLGQTADKKRCHWVIEKGGKLLEAKHGVKPADDAKNALAFIKSLATGEDEKKDDDEEKKDDAPATEEKKDDAASDEKKDE